MTARLSWLPTCPSNRRSSGWDTKVDVV